MSICRGVCLAKTFSFEALKNLLETKYSVKRYRDALALNLNNEIVFVFKFGVLVFWDIEDARQQHFQQEIISSYEEPLTEPLKVDFQYSYTGKQSYIKHDHIYMVSQEVLDKLAVSHGIAQSLKLEHFENQAGSTIAETAHIPRKIAATGKTDLSRRQLSQRRGQLYLVNADINVNFDLLDTPEFFWEYPEYENLYLLTARYLEINQRIEVLNKKLSVIDELLQMLADEENHKHSAALEWIIIWLIALEIIIFLLHDILQLF